MGRIKTILVKDSMGSSDIFIKISYQNVFMNSEDTWHKYTNGDSEDTWFI